MTEVFPWNISSLQIELTTEFRFLQPKQSQDQAWEGEVENL